MKPVPPYEIWSPCRFDVRDLCTPELSRTFRLVVSTTKTAAFLFIEETKMEKNFSLWWFSPILNESHIWILILIFICKDKGQVPPRTGHEGPEGE
jgi:hypothetical protein